MKNTERTNSNKLGLPVPSLSILKCPICNYSLAMEDGFIEKNMVIKANMKCICGYNAKIQNGIYIDNKAVRQRMAHGKPLPTKEEYLKASSPKFINFLYNGMSQLISNIERYGKKPVYIMELDNCVGFFLMHYIKKLPKNTTYILIDYDLDRITKIKQNLQIHHKHKNFIFLCCDIDRLPIAKGNIDIIVDNCLSTRYGLNKNKFLLDEVIDMVKEDGLITGIYRYFNPRTKDFIGLDDNEKKYFSRDIMVDKLQNSQVSLLDIVDSGPIIENNPYSPDIRGKKLYHANYIAIKKANENLKELRVMEQSKIS